MAIAAAGFLVSLYVHVASWTGKIVLPQTWSLGLQVGAFIPFAAALILTPKTRRRREVSQVPDARLIRERSVAAGLRPSPTPGRSEDHPRMIS